MRSKLTVPIEVGYFEVWTTAGTRVGRLPVYVVSRGLPYSRRVNGQE